MKDKLPNGWKECTLSGVCEIITDGTHHTPKYEDKGIIFLSSKNVTKGKIDWTDVKYVSEELHNQLKKRVSPKINDILLAKNGTTGVAAIVDKDLEFDIYVSLALLRPKNEILPTFLLNFINSPKAKEQFNSRLKGVGVPNLHLKEIKEVNLNLPPLDEQRQIIDLLNRTFEKLDKAIALVKENICKLKQLNDSVLDEVFRSENFPKVKIKNVVQKTGQFNPKNNPNIEYTYIDISAIDKEIQKITNPNSFLGKEAPSRAKKHIQKGDILFATTRPNLKNIAQIEDDFLNSVASTGFCVLRVNEKIENNFLFHFLTSQIIQEQILPLIRGAQYPAISDNDLLGCEIPLPSILEQQRIVKYLNQTTEKNQKLILYYQNKLEHLKRLKNSVLDIAFRGGLRKAKVISISQTKTDPFFAKEKKWNKKKNADKQVMIIALAMEAHEKIGKSLYRTKGEKTVEVIEKHIDLDFGREAKKMAAGPAAFEHLVKIVEPLAKEKRWFSVQEVKGENYDSHKYIKAENFNAFMMRCVLDLRPHLQEIRRVIDLFANMKTTHDAEVVATTYSGWNNLIIRKTQIDDEAIVTEARENWHDSKLKIERQEFFNAIEWLKNNNLIPQGNGREVI